MPQLCHMLIGPPASGKTTLAHQWLRQDPNLTWVSTHQNIGWMAWLLLPPLTTCRQRNQQRARHVPDPIIERAHNSLLTHPPTTAEGFIAIQTLPSE